MPRLRGQCLEDVKQAIEKVETEEHLVVHRIDVAEHFIQIFTRIFSYRIQLADFKRFMLKIRKQTLIRFLPV